MDAHVVEVDLVELGVPRDLPERLDGDPRQCHVQQEVRDPLVLGGVRVGARQEHHPVGHVREGGPDLLAVHHPVLAVLDRARLQRGEVAPGIGLGVALAPDLLAGEHLGGIALLLLLGPVGEDGGARHADGEDVEDRRGLHQRHLLVEDQFLHEGEPSPPVLLGPGEPHEAGIVELALPPAEEVVGVRPRNVGARPDCLEPVLREVHLQPGPNLVPEGHLLGGQREIHRPSCSAR